jgi:hypothetical protein
MEGRVRGCVIMRSIPPEEQRAAADLLADHGAEGLELGLAHQQVRAQVGLGSGRAVALELEAPTILVRQVYSG